MSSPAPASASNPDPDTYVLNNYDDNFLNYAELYTKPSDFTDSHQLDALCPSRDDLI